MLQFSTFEELRGSGSLTSALLSHNRAAARDPRHPGSSVEASHQRLSYNPHGYFKPDLWKYLDRKGNDDWETCFRDGDGKWHRRVKSRWRLRSKIGKVWTNEEDEQIGAGPNLLHVACGPVTSRSAACTRSAEACAQS